MNKIAVVRWADAEHVDTPSSAASVAKHKLPVLETVGFVVRDDENIIAVTMEHDPADDWMRNVSFIPRKWVVSVRYVDLDEKPKKRKR